MDIDSIKRQTEKIMEELLAVLDYPENSIFLMGCSSSEVLGKTIGKATNADIGEAVVTVVMKLIKGKKFALAVQCCEHLNRAIVLERNVAEKHGLEVVSVVPSRQAGGACSVAAFRLMEDPVVTEQVTAVAGIDIGDTFIGMHIKRVLVPVRLSAKEIGMAHVTAAKSRPRLIGGERAEYS